MGSKRLYRTEGPYKMLCGVCGGIAEYFDIYPWEIGRASCRERVLRLV